MATEIRNKETLLGTETNTDGTPVKEIVSEEGDVVAEITNKETLLGTETNDDGTPQQEIKPV
jgi:hypothetical protein